MQKEKKDIILNAIASTVKRLRGSKSQYLLGGEYDIPSSVLSELERGLKDPQLTTLFKLACSFNMTISQFIIELEKNLPENFMIFDD